MATALTGIKWDVDAPYCAIVEDDIRASAYANLWLQICKPRGIPITSNVSLEYLDTNRYMTTTQLNEMIADGCDVGLHTPHNPWTNAQYSNDPKAFFDALDAAMVTWLSLGLPVPHLVKYPTSVLDYNMSMALTWMRKKYGGFIGGLAGNGSQIVMFSGSTDAEASILPQRQVQIGRWRLGARSLLADTDTAFRMNASLRVPFFWVLHDVGLSAATGYDNYDMREVEMLVDRMIDRGVRFVTASDLLYLLLSGRSPHLVAPGRSHLTQPDELINTLYKLSVTATGGSYVLTVDDQDTEALAYNSSTDQIRDALLPLAGNDYNNVSVKRGVNNTYTEDCVIAFCGDFEGVVKTLSVKTNPDDPLSGGTATVATGNTSPWSLAGKPIGLKGTYVTAMSETAGDFVRFAQPDANAWAMPELKMVAIKRGQAYKLQIMARNGTAQPKLYLSFNSTDVQSHKVRPYITVGPTNCVDWTLLESPVFTIDNDFITSVGVKFATNAGSGGGTCDYKGWDIVEVES